MMESMKKTHIIIGTSAAAIGALNKLRSLDPESEIICISDEKELPYNKCFLVDAWKGEKYDSQVATKPLEVFRENNISLLLGVSLVKIDPANNSIECNNGQTFAYTTLLVTTGSRARRLSIAGSDDSRVFYFHSLHDFQWVQKFIDQKKVKTDAVIGSGFTGLEVADALNKQGVKTHVIERGSRVLGRMVDRQGAEFIHDAMAQKGVELITNDEVVKITSNQIQLKSGKNLVADMVIVAIGVIPNSEFAAQAGIEVLKGGIKTDEQMCTNTPNIFAAGDVAVVKDRISGEFVNSCMWADAMMQGLVAAHGMAGVLKEYPGAIITGISAFFGLDFMSSGSFKDVEGQQTILHTKDGSYRRYTLKDEVLQSFVMIGQLKNVGVARRALYSRQAIGAHSFI